MNEVEDDAKRQQQGQAISTEPLRYAPPFQMAKPRVEIGLRPEINTPLVAIQTFDAKRQQKTPAIITCGYRSLH